MKRTIMRNRPEENPKRHKSEDTKDGSKKASLQKLPSIIKSPPKPSPSSKKTDLKKQTELLDLPTLKKSDSNLEMNSDKITKDKSRSSTSSSFKPPAEPKRSSSTPKPSKSKQVSESKKPDSPPAKTQLKPPKPEQKKKPSQTTEKSEEPAENSKDTPEPFKPPSTPTNQFSHIVSMKKSEISICQCDPIVGDCSEGCVNRALQIECSPNYCPCKERCTNNRFQKRQYPNITLIDAGAKGSGVITNDEIKKGQFIIEYVGEIIEIADCAERMKDQRHFYFLTIDAKIGIDASRKGNNARFINHSCEPNCATQKWFVLNQTRIGIFSLVDIPPGTELTFDYQFERIGSAKQKCYCGSKNCRGYLGAKPVDKKEAAKPPKNIFSNHKKYIQTLTKDIDLEVIDQEIKLVVDPEEFSVKNRSDNQPVLFLRAAHRYMICVMEYSYNISAQKAAYLTVLHQYVHESYLNLVEEERAHEDEIRKKREASFLYDLDFEKRNNAKARGKSRQV